jgi:hypothetical protein
MSPFLQNLEATFKRGLILQAYLAVWFCALIFLSDSILQEDGVPYLSFGFAILKASALSRFMLIGQKLFPLPFARGSSVLWLVFRRSLIDTGFVLLLSYIFFGIEGAIHGKGFVETLHNFCGGSVQRVVALSLCYWLIILPYLIYCGLKKAMGAESLYAYLLGVESQKRP